MKGAFALATKPVLALSAALATLIAMPAGARDNLTTRVVDCAAGSCLIVRGRRDSPAAQVTINGRPVVAQGARLWRVSVPVETLRQWSAPHARSITVAVTDTCTGAATTAQTRLPIGLLGHSQDLAMLVVRVK